MLFLACLLGAVSLLPLLDTLLFAGKYCYGLPGYLPTAVSLTGVLICLCVYAARKAKKRSVKGRSRAMAALCFCLIACLIATGFWLFRLYLAD